MSNPRYADDIFRLDRFYDTRKVINEETVIIVVGTSIVAELLDRQAAELCAITSTSAAANIHFVAASSSPTMLGTTGTRQWSLPIIP
jgi:hypothetical protein